MSGSDGGPTSRSVRGVPQPKRTPGFDMTSPHPAQYSAAILDAIAPVLTEWRLSVHDPFAGPGVRLGRLCDQLGLQFSGTEIEQPFIEDPRVCHGDSTEWETYPTHAHCIVTSPAYPNGMADHFKARDGSQRHTYRQARATIVGEDAPLAPNNMGRHGVRSGKKAERRHFTLAVQALRYWPDHVVVNVSNFIVAGRLYDLVGGWVFLLWGSGYELRAPIEVVTPRQRKGANGALRAEFETILVAERG